MYYVLNHRIRVYYFAKFGSFSPTILLLRFPSVFCSVVASFDEVNMMENSASAFCSLYTFSHREQEQKIFMQIGFHQ